ncbi:MULTISPECIES: hypothetical protein [unclassified Actinoplanes]|uniref:hypothetical protein n=1 Tax=unclassified Actinoplanes TaxID=2626549 RepID=UPI0006938F3A|nr:MULTISPECIES: hypothetical protein [unclassified Actinoplanes]
MTPPEDDAWVPEACTLPTADRPLRVAEFDRLFATALRGQRRLSPTTLCWELDPAAEAEAREAAGRESGCCSFFTFAFEADAAALRVRVTVPAGQIGVLDGLQQRAAGQAGARGGLRRQAGGRVRA